MAMSDVIGVGVIVILTFIIGWQLSRMFMRWQGYAKRPTIEIPTVDKSTVYKVAEEAMTYGWRAAKNGFSITYPKDGEVDGEDWAAWFFKTMIHDHREHAFYMRKYTVEEGLIDLTESMPVSALHQPIIQNEVPSYLPEGDYA